MAGFMQYRVLDGQDPWAVNWFFDKMPRQMACVFVFDVSWFQTRGTELLAYLDPHNLWAIGVTQWDDLPANREAPSFDEPFATEIFNMYFWPMMCHTIMRRFLTSNSRPVEHQGFLANFVEETDMGIQGDGWRRFFMSSTDLAGLEPRPTVDCYRHELVADTFRMGSIEAPAGGLGNNADTNSMDGRIVFSFTFDNRFHMWFSQVCMASFGDFLQNRFNMPAHGFLDSAVGGRFPPVGNQHMPSHNAMGPCTHHVGTFGQQNVVIKREGLAITAEDHRNAVANGHMPPHRARDCFSWRESLQILERSVAAKYAGGALGTEQARTHQLFVGCHFETNQAHSELLKTMMLGTWIGNQDTSEEIQALRLVYKHWGTELFPIKVNEPTLANIVPKLVDDLMKGYYKPFMGDTLDIIREMTQSTSVKEAYPSTTLEWCGVITMVDAAKRLMNWIMWPQHPSRHGGGRAMDPTLPSFSELLIGKLSNLREFHRIDKYQEMSEQILKPIMGRTANLISGPNGWMQQKGAAYLPSIAVMIYYSTPDTLLPAKHLPTHVKLFVKDT
jgi:hypothetical protein